MAILTIETNGEDPTSVSFIISPSDAWRIIEEFKNKYPNREEGFPTLKEFMRRWSLSGDYPIVKPPKFPEK